MLVCYIPISLMKTDVLVLYNILFWQICQMMYSSFSACLLFVKKKVIQESTSHIVQVLILQTIEGKHP